MDTVKRQVIITNQEKILITTVRELQLNPLQVVETLLKLNDNKEENNNGKQ